MTNQIVALAREYVAKRDALLMDAWRNGGTFEGKKVTDDMVLGYWENRMKDLDPSDPTYEEAKNQVMQLEYAVAQSKADVLHVQGKLSDTAYAQFFLRWAKKVPKNSEFYRVLQKDAAQLIEAAKAKSRAGSEAAKTEAFNKFVSNTTRDQIAIGDAMTQALNDLSKATGLSITGNGDELLALLTQNVKANPDQYKYLLDTINTSDPGFDGTLDEAYFSQHIRDATRGYELIADRAMKQGYTSAYASATQGMASMSSWGQNLRVWPVAESYSMAMAQFEKVLADPNASQMDKMAAANAASAQLMSLAGTPGIDAGSKTMIEADAQRLLGQDAGDNPSFGSSMLGRAGVTPQLGAQLAAWNEMKLQMDANPAAFAYAPVDASGNFDPTGTGPLGIVPSGQVQPGAQAVMVPGANGEAVMAMVMPHSVYVQDPNNPGGNPKLAGYQISYNVGGRTIEMWGYKDAQGGNRWSLVSPVAEGATTARDNKGDVFITPGAATAADPIAKAKEIDAQLGTNIAAQLLAQQQAGSPLGATVELTQRDKNGKETGSIKLAYGNGTFTATQNTSTLDKDGRVVGTSSTPITIPFGTPQASAFSQSRLAAGDVPGITYSSPLETSVKAAGYTQTQDQVNKYASDPAFQQAFLSQTMQTLGISNPSDPRVAKAWQSATTGDPVSDTLTGFARKAMLAMEREDLSYPGYTSPTQLTGNLPGIQFGRPTLVIPTAPGAKTDQYQDTFDRTKGWAGVTPQTLPGLGAPAMTPTGSPAPSVTPTVTTVTPAPTTVTPSPTAVTPSPTPAPAPTPAPGISPTKLKLLENY